MISRRSTLSVMAVAVVAGSLGLAPRQAEARRAKACAPPPIEVMLCVDDPCDCCPAQEVCVCVPCCCTEAPCVSWRDGMFGRRVATYSWECCGHSVEVVVTRKGELIVR
ncbi:MAG TPA: hypothetical protein VEQ85_06320 [Lacipirellulaceae bacterium]|nr:hypothetical protein [Lacipirellulaceae bacterium]